jgi:hypothetical protein
MGIVVSVLGVGGPAMMVVNHRAIEQGQTPPLVGANLQQGDILLYAGSCTGLLLVIALISTS